MVAPVVATERPIDVIVVPGAVESIDPVGVGNREAQPELAAITVTREHKMKSCIAVRKASPQLIVARNVSGAARVPSGHPPTPAGPDLRLPDKTAVQVNVPIWHSLKSGDTAEAGMVGLSHGELPT